MGRRSLEVHDHSKSGSGGAQLNPTKLGIPEFATDSEAPNETLYFESTAEQVRYKDENGTVHAAAGLQNGENFDGQDTSEFTNLAAVETEQASIGQVVGEAGQTTAQSIPTGTFADVAFDATKTEDANIVTVDLANNRIQIIEDGTYLVIGKIEFQADTQWSAGDQIIVESKIDEVVRDGIGTQHPGGTAEGYSPPNVVGVVDATGTTNVQIRTRQQSGGSVDLTGVERRVWLKVVRLG